MMRALVAAATAILIFAASSAPSSAGSRSYYICWTGLDGASACSNLPRNFSLPGVRRPARRNGTVTFQLTRSQIAVLGRYGADTENMRPAYEATIYAPKRSRSHRRSRVLGFSRRRSAVRSFKRRRSAVRGSVQRRPATRRSLRRDHFLFRRSRRRS